MDLFSNVLNNSVIFVQGKKLFDNHKIMNRRMACKGRKICNFVHPQKGVPLKKAEIIPIEPDTGNAVEGILSSF